MIDWQQVAVWVMGVLLILFGAVLKTLWDATQQLAKDLKALEKDLSSTYVRRDDLSEWKDEMLTMLRRIEDKLDGKVDKP